MSLQASQHTCRSEQNFQESTPSYHDGFQGSSSNKHAFMSRVPTLTTPFLGTCFILPVCLCMYRFMCVQMYVCLYVCLRGGIDISFWCLLQSLSTLIFSQNLNLCSSAVCSVVQQSALNAAITGILPNSTTQHPTKVLGT